MPKKIAFLGPVGTYTEDAALKYDPTAILWDCSTIIAVGEAVASGEAEQGIVPIENNLEGLVTYAANLLVHDNPGVLVCGEVVLPIDHYLMVSPGMNRQDIRTIYSHPQSLGQCYHYLHREFPGVQQVTSTSNSQAIKEALENTGGAAIASKRAAGIYNATIVDSSIQDNPINETRFLVLGLDQCAPTGKDKTSMYFSFTEKGPGLLYRALQVFAERSIDLTKIESRPARQSMGRYIFLVDCEGHQEDPLVAEALELLRSHTEVLTILGSYPEWNGNTEKEVIVLEAVSTTQE